MIKIHKIEFENFENQNEVWEIYRELKKERKGFTMLEILKEIAGSQNFYKKNKIKKNENQVFSKIKYSKLIDMENLKSLIELAENTIDPDIKIRLKAKINEILNQA